MKVTYQTKDIETVEEYAKSIIIPGQFLYIIEMEFPISKTQQEITVILRFSKEPKPIKIHKVQNFSKHPVGSFEENENILLVEGLTHLICTDSLLVNLKGLPQSLIYLNCSKNKLTNLSANF